jgi:hypothetical protein
MNNAKAIVVWVIVLVLAMMLLVVAITGRLAIVASVAFTPDNVAYIGG